MTVAFVITGRVQGVGYRAFVQRIADDHDVDGEVFNTESGTVEGVAHQVNPAKLYKFLEKLKSGPGAPRNAVWHESATGPMTGSGFHVTNTRP